MQKNKNFKAIKKSRCTNYDMLGQAFDKSTATGALHHASTQLPPTSDEERQNEDRFLNKGVHITECEKSGTGSSKGKRIADESIPGCVRLKKESKIEKLDSCLEMWKTSLCARVEKDLAKSEKYKEKYSQATSPISDPYSIEECMDVLEMIDDVSDASFNKSLEKFKDRNWRKMFIKMSAPRKKMWLKSLE